MKLSDFFKDGTGAPSMMRLIVFVVTAAIIVVFLFGNIMGFIQAVMDHKPITFIDFAAQMVYVLGIVLLGKVGQAGIELFGGEKKKE